MIQLKINNMDHKAILTVPAEYERVILALWTIGLVRDPEKYILRQLDAEFTYTTEEESQMVRLIDPRSSLMNALCFLSEMVYPPYPVAERIHKKMAAEDMPLRMTSSLKWRNSYTIRFWICIFSISLKANLFQMKRLAFLTCV